RASSRARQLDREVKNVTQTHHKTEELELENARLAKTAELLFEAKGSGEQVAHKIATMEHPLPDEFWITKLFTDLRSDPELRIPKGSDRPIVSMSGRAREGTHAAPAQVLGL